MSATILYSGTDDIFGHIEKITVRQINRSYPTATWSPSTYVMESNRYVTEIAARNIFVTSERCRIVPRLSGDSTEQSLIVELMNNEFDVAIEGYKAIGCRVSNMSRGVPSVRDFGFYFRDALFVGEKIVDDLVEEDMLGNLLFVSINDQIVGFVETFKKFKRRTKVAGKGPFGGSGLATKHYRIDCNNLTFDLECLEEESETLLLEDKGRGVVATFVYGKPHKHTACPHDCLGLKLTEIGTYLEKFVSATMTTEEEWIQDYVLKGGMMVIEKSKFSWVEQCVMNENSWDKSAPRQAGQKTRFVIPLPPRSTSVGDLDVLRTRRDWDLV